MPMAKLDVYISETCWSCDEAKEIVADMRPRFPSITIELRDINDECRPSTVFATPTYVLDGRTIFLGNPTREQLQQKLEEVQDSGALH
jgi:alkyl hydroperoxide reductase subunit AhpF